MLKYIKLSDGHQLIAEVHQASTLVGPVHIAIPNTPEAERMVIMMNKNFPAYVGHVLKDQGLPEIFLFELVRQSCCLVMASEINQCTWDSNTGTLVTKQDAKVNKNEEDLEKASWFKDTFANLGIALNGGSSKKQAPPPEILFNLDGERSIKTIHQRNKAQPSNVGSAPPKKGKDKDLINISSKEESDKESAPSSGKQGRLHAAATVGEDESPTSSDEVDGQAPGAADGG
jgi:hypothetical protein